jgi:hypothetical protein
MSGERATGGVLSLVTFFAQAKKVTRSPEGRVEALSYATPKQDQNGFRLSPE